MTLQNELRDVLTLNNDMSPLDVQRVVFDRRTCDSRKQKLSTFTNVMAKMPDVESYRDGNNQPKRRLLKASNIDRLEAELARIIKIVLEFYRELVKLWQKMQKNATAGKSKS